ncbi:MAG TPA: glycosyltransferase [bacterium]|nr:glycosyltransferase [bacterium]
MTETQKPVVSIIIPTRNRREKLREAVDSVLAQEGAGVEFDTEIIVVDDASTDDTPRVVPTWRGVRYIRLDDHKNTSAARNAGIAASRGDYLAFLDDDDLLLPCFARTLLSPGADVAYSSVITEGDGVRKPQRNTHHPSGDVFLDILRHNVFIHIAAILIRRQIVVETGCFDESLPAIEDHDLLLRIAHRHRFVFVPGPVAIYRQSSSGLWISTVSAGHHVALLRRVYEHAMSLHPLPAGTKAAVLDHVDVYSMEQWTAHMPPGEPEDHAAHILARLRECPRLTRYPRYRHVAAHVGRTLAVTRSVETAEAFAAEIHRAAGRTLQANRLLARVWIEIGIGLCLAGRWRSGCDAFFVAASRDPTQFLARLAKVCRERAHGANLG